MFSTTSWITDATDRLLRLRNGAGGWAYHVGQSASSEPTAMAGLALCSDSGEADLPMRVESLTGAARWAAQMQQADGSLGLSDDLPGPRWPTALALLLWSNVEGFSSQSEHAARWLERARGKSFRKVPESPAGHDTSIVGWPWVEGTHAWVEPTAMAILALARVGLAKSPRVDEGVRLLLDRAVPRGGWNYGNNVVLRTALRPQPGSTGLVLLALASVGVRDQSVGQALDYLESVLPQIRSAQSVCWGLLGAAAWNRRPAKAQQWLRDAFEEIYSDEPDAAFQLAHLLLAANGRALDLFGVTALSEVSPS